MIGEKELDDILVWQSIQSAYKRKTKVESKEKFKDKYQCFISDSMNIIYDSGLWWLYLICDWWLHIIYSFEGYILS